MFRFLVLFFGMYYLAGCASNDILHQPEPDDPYYAPIVPEQKITPVIHSGSLYAASLSNSLYSDAKARRVGDIITVILQENTQASKNAKTEYDREQTYTLNPITGLNGTPVSIGGNNIALGVDSENEFAGDATSDQSNSLSGSISVTIQQVLPNGNLVINGEKWMTLNTGKEYIRLAGIIRQQDINSANTIASQKIANARIDYSGTGSFQRGQQPGWLSKFFASPLWPF